jgi:amino-acid N-acetyltransferase
MVRAALRAATVADQDAIVALVRSERLNPNGLHWPHFIVAALDGQVVGAVQMRHHADGSRELGSLVVAKDFRGRGIAGQLIGRLLMQHPGAAHLITPRVKARRYAYWGFRAIAPWRAPRSVCLNYCMGQLASALALLQGRAPRRLAVLARE